MFLGKMGQKTETFPPTGLCFLCEVTSMIVATAVVGENVLGTGLGSCKSSLHKHYILTMCSALCHSRVTTVNSIYYSTNLHDNSMRQIFLLSLFTHEETEA